MTSRVRAITAAVLTLSLACGDSGGALRVEVARAADAPFAMFGETRLALGDACLRVLVAESSDQRVQGLRNVRSLGPYDGMIFVYDRDTEAKFTMANTPLPLDITFFDRAGEPVDRTQMTPCAEGTDATCPLYGSKSKYRYALERPAPASGNGALGSCA